MDYDEFREQYEKMYPASVPQEPDYAAIESEYPRWLTPLALVMFIAVSIVSGAHTISTMRYNMEASLVIPENLKDAVAASAFFGFELALFVSVFGWLRKDKRWIAIGATGVVFLVIVLANVQDVIRSVQTQDILNIALSIGQSIGTPLVALFSGKLLVDFYQRDRYVKQKAKAEYLEAKQEWDKQIVTAWKRENKPSKRVQLSVQTVQSEPSAGYVKDASTIAREHLEDNAQDRSLSGGQLAKKLGIGRTTAYNVLKEFSTNGHHTNE